MALPIWWNLVYTSDLKSVPFLATGSSPVIGRPY